jgi:ABC-type oligopeptide transport system ATPase subunit
MEEGRKSIFDITLLAEVNSELSRIPIILFPEYETFLHNPDVRLQGKLVFGHSLPGLAFLQGHASDPISISAVSLDYYNLINFNLYDLQNNISKDVAKIVANQDVCIDVYNRLMAGKASVYLFKAITCEEKYVQFGLQIASVLRYIARDQESLFESIFRRVEDEIDRRTRETELQKEERAIAEEEIDREALEAEVGLIREHWNNKIMRAPEDVEKKFEEIYKEVDQQSQEQIQLLVDKYTDIMNKEILVVDEEFRRLEFACERDAIKILNNTKTILYSGIERLKQQITRDMELIKQFEVQNENMPN